MERPWYLYYLLFSTAFTSRLPTQRYQQLSPKQKRVWARKRRMIRRVWLGSMGVVMVYPAVYMLLAAALFATFLSFAIIDEIPYR